LALLVFAETDDQVDAFLDLAVAIGDQVLDVLGCLRRTRRQAAYFRGSHCEAAAGFARARNFHSSIQRKKVSLLRDHADELVCRWSRWYVLVFVGLVGIRRNSSKQLDATCHV
jgi:hypothetical protein